MYNRNYFLTPLPISLCFPKKDLFELCGNLMTLDGGGIEVYIIRTVSEVIRAKQQLQNLWRRMLLSRQE